MAGTRGDALKAVEYMPGVARGSDGLRHHPRLGTRATREVQFEGAPVYRLYHFGDLTSFVNSRMLERIDLYPGNFSARYGRKLGGIIDVGIRDPKTDRFHGMVDINVVDSQMLIETPIGKTCRAGGRRQAQLHRLLHRQAAARGDRGHRRPGLLRLPADRHLPPHRQGSDPGHGLRVVRQLQADAEEPGRQRSQHPRQLEPRRPAFTGGRCCGSAAGAPTWSTRSA